MGAWGPGLYQDDVTCDIKGDYVDRLKVGYTNEEATKEVIEYNERLIEDEDDGPLFWFALADTQWKYGRLLSYVREEALKCIEKGADLERWREENPKQALKREKVLEELKKRLNSPQPPEKKVTKLIPSKSPWNIGDILLYQIKCPELTERDKDIPGRLEDYYSMINHKWYHKYVLLKVIGKTRSRNGSLPSEYDNERAIFSMYNWVGDEEPSLKFIKDLSLVKDRFKFKNRELWQGILFFTKRESKWVNFRVVQEAVVQKEEPFMDDRGILWHNINNFDYELIQVLEFTEKNGNLIDTTSQ